MSELILCGRRIADDADCYVIAEVGHNHQGSVEKCKELFDAAKWAGADAVKLQKRDNKTLYSEEYYNSPYNSEHSFGATYGEHREALEFGWDEYSALKDYAERIGLDFFATAFDIPSLEFLMKLGCGAIKIASGDLHNRSLLEATLDYAAPVILSTGGSSIEDVLTAVNDCSPEAILQCTSGYPARYEHLNLRVIETFRAIFPGIVVGFSSHDTGITAPVIAYALGARIIEKHFTLDRASKGTDQAMSLEPKAFAHMVENLKLARLSMGDGAKRIYESERAPLAKQWKNADGQIDGRVSRA
jgi:sialic acid synthase